MRAIDARELKTLGRRAAAALNAPLVLGPTRSFATQTVRMRPRMLILRGANPRRFLNISVAAAETGERSRGKT